MKTVNQTIKFAEELKQMGLDQAQFHCLDLYPGTEFWEMALRGEGSLRPNYDLYDWSVFSREIPHVETNDVTIGDINGTFSAEMTNGSGAYAIYAGSDLTTGDIGNDANITALAISSAYGLYSGGSGTLSIHTGDINGKISAETIDGSYAYGMYSASDINVGDIGSNAEITATAGGGGSYAYGMYSAAGNL